MNKIIGEVTIESSVDTIISEIREQIISGELAPGDRLPSERKLAEKFGIGRTQVRTAIAKLEFYGILKTLPQSGTVVAGIGIIALEGLITDVLKLEETDFASLIETRVLLEIDSCKKASERRTIDDIISMQKALDAFEVKVKSGQPAVEEDLLFHLTIAKAAQNSVLKSLMLIITPEIVHSFTKLDVCKDGRFYLALEEHKEILQYIVDKDAEMAAEAMRKHLKDVIDYSQSIVAGGK